MSTTHQMFTAEERDLFVELLKEWPNSESGTDEASHGVSPFVSFYFPPSPDNHLEAALLLVDIHEAFEQLAGHPYTMAMHEHASRPHRYPERRPDLRQQAREASEHNYFVFSFTDEQNHASSPATAGYFWRGWFKGGDRKTAYSSIVFYYRWQWWLDNREAWRRFVLKTIDQLKAHQVYSGFAMANPLEFGTRSEVTTWERSLTPAFYGLDIEYAYGMDDELPSGIRPPTWAFLLSDYWRDKLDLSREQVRTALAHPRISVTELHSGQWIELGEQPQLYPVEHGVPELPVLLNRLLKPIRYDDLGLLGFGQWDGDPNERFTDADSRRWMARFDADSDWPTPASRVNAPPALSTQSAPGTMAACFVAGMACPQAGWWFAVDQADSRRAFKQGETFPERLSDCGDTLLLWQRDPDQTPPEPARYANSHQPAPRAGRWEMALDRCVECEVLLNQPLPAHQGQSVGWHWTLPGMRARSDEPCPYPGGWVCEYKPDSQRVLDYATAMPRIDGEKVVWLWTGFHPA